MTKWLVRIVVGGVCFLFLGLLMMPSLCRSSETANRVKCHSNLKQIGQAIQLYASANGGALPDSFATLVLSGDLVPEVFVCPSSNAERAESLQALATGATPKTCSYTYLGDGLTESVLTADVVLMIEDIEDHDQDGINVLFGDGQVDFMANNRRRPSAWDLSLQAQVKAGVRPVRPTTMPAEAAPGIH